MTKTTTPSELFFSIARTVAPTLTEKDLSRAEQIIVPAALEAGKGSLSKERAAAVDSQLDNFLDRKP